MEYLLVLMSLLGFSTTVSIYRKLLVTEKENINLKLKLTETNTQLAFEKEKAEIARQNLLEHVETQRNYNQETKALIDITREKLSETFKAVSSEVLANSNKQFLDLAAENLNKWQNVAAGELNVKHTQFEALVDPIKESLSKLDNRLNTVEKDRASTASSLQEQIKSLNGVQDSLRRETSNLVKALRTPNVRGRWGELQLKKVVEMSGMVDHCDFDQQVTVDTDDGKLRPDMIVHLPNNKNLVVDSKVPLSAFIDSLEATDDEMKVLKLKDHCRQVKSHINSLALKAYWDQFDDTPEFIIMFMPGESFFNAAVEQDPDLIEYAFQRNVILTTPISFMAVLKSVAYGWQQEALAANSKKISELGTELYDRIRTFTNNFVDIKKGLDKAVEAYNKSVTSLESRVLVTARKLTELGVTPVENIIEVEQVDKIAKLPSTPVIKD